MKTNRIAAVVLAAMLPVVANAGIKDSIDKTWVGYSTYNKVFTGLVVADVALVGLSAWEINHRGGWNAMITTLKTDPKTFAKTYIFTELFLVAATTTLVSSLGVDCRPRTGIERTTEVPLTIAATFELAEDALKTEEDLVKAEEVKVAPLVKIVDDAKAKTDYAADDTKTAKVVKAEAIAAAQTKVEAANKLVATAKKAVGDKRVKLIAAGVKTGDKKYPGVDVKKGTFDGKKIVMDGEDEARAPKMVKDHYVLADSDNKALAPKTEDKVTKIGKQRVVLVNGSWVKADKDDVEIVHFDRRADNVKAYKLALRGLKRFCRTSEAKKDAYKVGDALFFAKPGVEGTVVNYKDAKEALKAMETDTKEKKAAKKKAAKRLKRQVVAAKMLVKEADLNK